MGLNFSTSVYLPAFDMFARYATFTPVVSQGAGAASYLARVIWHDGQQTVPLEDGSYLQDQRKYIDILAAEFGIPPQQGDQVNIGPDGGVPAEGDFEITNVTENGGGETSLDLKKIETAVPTPPTTPGVPVDVSTGPTRMRYIK